jgi:hypothetical protein
MTSTENSKSGHGLDVDIWDTPGEIHDLCKAKALPNVESVVLCFSVDSPESMPDMDDVVRLTLHCALDRRRIKLTNSTAVGAVNKESVSWASNYTSCFTSRPS